MATSNFPQDIVEEILLRLPVKSLVRFTLVSTSWGSLISSSPFVKLHFQRASKDPRIRTQNLLLLIDTNDLKLFKDTDSFLGNEVALEPLDFPLKRRNQRVKILGSCSGLVALALKEVQINNFFIWNPSTLPNLF